MRNFAKYSRGLRPCNGSTSSGLRSRRPRYRRSWLPATGPAQGWGQPNRPIARWGWRAAAAGSPTWRRRPTSSTTVRWASSGRAPPRRSGPAGRSGCRLAQAPTTSAYQRCGSGSEDVPGSCGGFTFAGGGCRRRGRALSAGAKQGSRGRRRPCPREAGRAGTARAGRATPSGTRPGWTSSAKYFSEPGTTRPPRCSGTSRQVTAAAAQSRSTALSGGVEISSCCRLCQLRRLCWRGRAGAAAAAADVAGGSISSGAGVRSCCGQLHALTGWLLPPGPATYNTRTKHSKNGFVFSKDNNRYVYHRPLKHDPDRL